ncbi:MAG: CAP domain-containing protein, partial [Gaiellaceae bacterium]
CGKFEHAACGRPSDQVATDAGYVATGGWGENLYVGEGHRGAPRVAMDDWLNSPQHRENLFLPQWRTAGLAAMHDVTVDDFRHAVVWVSQFGDR